jgi:hypothetical protein
MFRCIDCAQVKPMQTNGGTGYGINEHDFFVCYDCCGKQDEKFMRDNGRITLYLVKRDNEYFVTNWPGTINIRAHVRTSWHNIAGKRYDAWFKHAGANWHGVTYGDNTQICHCKRTKQ